LRQKLRPFLEANAKLFCARPEKPERVRVIELKAHSRGAYGAVWISGSSCRANASSTEFQSFQIDTLFGEAAAKASRIANSKLKARERSAISGRPTLLKFSSRYW
jgi:hypothetical protein